MSSVKLSKQSLREQEKKLKTLEKYLPTLKLKKALLQQELRIRAEEIKEKREARNHAFDPLSASYNLWKSGLPSLIPTPSYKEEFIAGVSLNLLQAIEYAPLPTYPNKAPWSTRLIDKMKRWIESTYDYAISKENIQKLQDELEEVSIRVNLFEKRLIPQTEKEIKRIRIFLGDQELAAISRAKVTKNQLEARHGSNSR